MDKVKNVTKNGWHPTGKDGGKESWRGDFKGINTVAGLVGKGKKPNDTAALDHRSRPLNSLKDPAAFGPPPKNANYYGKDAAEGSSPTDRTRLGSPSPRGNIYARPWEQPNQANETTEGAAAKKPTPPPVPFRANTTGLSVAGLPPPPARRDHTGEGEDTSKPIKKPKPNLPPRLPPRQNSHPDATTPSPPPAYSATPPAEPSQNSSYLNQNAINRLNTAGVSVPGLGIGNHSSTSPQPHNPWRDEPSSNPSSQPPAPTTSPLNNLTSRFSSLNTTTTPNSTSTSPQPPQPPPQTQGTTLAQKQAALQTASAFHKDPSSVSLADARATASTANNFRERHGDQVASGWKTGNALNKKYGVMDKVGGFGGDHTSASTGNTNASSATSEGGVAGNAAVPAAPSSGAGCGGGGGMGVTGFGQAVGSAFNRKAPPPPTPPAPLARRPTPVGPPVPLGSKPR